MLPIAKLSLRIGPPTKSWPRLEEAIPPPFTAPQPAGRQLKVRLFW